MLKRLFNFGTPAKEPLAEAEPSPVKLARPVSRSDAGAASPFRSPLANADSTGGFTGSDFDELGVDGAPAVIKTISDFPAIKSVLTSPDNPDPGLRIPLALRDQLIAVQLDSRHARVYVDPASRSKTLAHVPALQSALSAVGISAGGRPHFADASVIAAVRQSHEKSADRKSGSIGMRSAGAALFREWISLAHEEKATDLHIRVVDGGKALVQIRVNGALENLPGAQDGLVTEGDALNALKSAYELLSDTKSNNTGTYSATMTLSSMIDAALGIPNLRVRYASIRGLHGPKGVMRLLPTSAAGGMSFEQMGFAASHIDHFERAQRMDTGSVGLMGVTGSGKTTAAKAFIDTHPRRHEISLYQVADPIEYPIDGMHQIYVQRELVVDDAGSGRDAYAEVIGSVLRLDPEMVDVGEVRDGLSARAMANTAKSGHMALYTLHVGSVQGAINRLTDPNIGLSRQELTSGDMLALLCYQSLSAVLCDSCSMELGQFQEYLQAQDAEDARRELRQVHDLVSELRTKYDMDPSVLRFRNPCGCGRCKRRGTTGLTILAEVLMPEAPWLDLAGQHRDRDAMMWWRQTYSDRNVFSGNQHGKLVQEHAIYKASRGIVDPRQIEKYGPLKALEVIR